MSGDDKPDRLWLRIGKSHTANFVYVSGFAYWMRTVMREDFGVDSVVVDQLLLFAHYGLLAVWLWIMIRLWLENRREWQKFEKATACK